MSILPPPFHKTSKPKRVVFRVQWIARMWWISIGSHLHAKRIAYRATKQHAVIRARQLAQLEVDAGGLAQVGGAPQVGQDPDGVDLRQGPAEVSRMSDHFGKDAQIRILENELAAAKNSLLIQRADYERLYARATEDEARAATAIALESAVLAWDAAGRPTAVGYWNAAAAPDHVISRLEAAIAASRAAREEREADQCECTVAAATAEEAMRHCLVHGDKP